MKNSNIYSSCIAFLMLIACSKPSDTVSEIPVEGEYPSGAQITSYEDMPGWEKVTQLDNGNNVKAEGNYYNGLKEGTWTEYDNRGLLQKVTSYSKGKLHGVDFTFNRGNLEGKSYYINGILNGESLVYKSRRIIERKNYLNGQLEGVVYRYYNNGKVMQEAPYKQGQLHGIAKWYDQEGNLSIAYEYEDGDLINQNVEIDEQSSND